MAEFILFGTEGCHLCEEAEAVLVEANVVYQLEDIMDDNEWQEKFGLLIPVLWQVESQKQLNWPFDSEKVKNFPDYQEISVK